MKHIILAILLLIALSLVACSTPQITPTQTVTSNPNEETDVRGLVENFGKRLQAVSLLSPNVVQEMQEQYSEFVSPALLDTWTSDISKAPGRIVSSPWPDRTEITTVTKEESDKYVIHGFVIDVTSVEIANGGAAAKRPVRIVVQRGQDRWLITEYAEEG